MNSETPSAKADAIATRGVLPRRARGGVVFSHSADDHVSYSTSSTILPCKVHRVVVWWLNPLCSVGVSECRGGVGAVSIDTGVRVSGWCHRLVSGTVKPY